MLRAHGRYVALGVALGLAAGLVVGALIGRARGVPFVSERRDWAIGIYEGASPAELRPAQGARNPVLTAQDVSDLDAESVCDPFLVQRDGLWHMFFEVLERTTNIKRIGLATSPDALAWVYRGIALAEPFDVSYPHVFEWEGVHYMLPETPGSRSLRLYRAAEFPTRWELVATLLEGAPFAAPTLFRFEGRWWLFTGAGRHDILRLFHADQLTGPWVEHPQSPLIWEDPERARPAGRVVLVEGRPVRFAQDCRPAYGSAVRAFVVEELTPERYRERALTDAPVLAGSGAGWNAGGMHHADLHPRPEGGWVAAVDGWRQVRVFGLGH